MRYAATMAALRPGRGLSNGIGRIGDGRHRTHPGLTMDQNAMAFVKLDFNEGDTCYKMIQDVLFLDVVNFDLFVGESLLE